MASIRTIEYYNGFAKQFAEQTWQQTLDIPIVENKRRKKVAGAFLYLRNTEQSRDGHKRIDLSFKHLHSHEEVIETIKHELCRWYCYTNHLDFKDGDKDFEAELLKIKGTSSHFGYLDKDKSSFIQQKTVDDLIGHKGFKETTYRKIDKKRMIEMVRTYRPHILNHQLYGIDRAYEVIYKGVKIGYAFSYHNAWLTIAVKGKQDTKRYTSRKQATYYLVYQYESEIA